MGTRERLKDTLSLRGGAGCALVGLAIVALNSSLPVTSGMLVGFFLAIMLALVAQFPVVSTVLFVALFATASLGVVDHLPAMAFLVPLFCGVQAFFHQRVWIFAPAAAMLVLGMYDSDDGVIQWDFLGFVIWAFTITAAMGLGWLLSKRQAHLEALHDYRENLASSLHDSVVASLTSVTMRAESLTLVSPQEVDVSAELKSIANDARLSMTQIRALIRVLKLDSLEIPSDIEPTSETIHQLVTRLREAGFNVETNASTDTGTNTDLNQHSAIALGRVLPELGTNIIKHAPPFSRVSIQSTQSERDFSLSIANDRKHSPTSPYLSSGHGLESIRAMVEKVGGRVEGGVDKQKWLALITLPR